MTQRMLGVVITMFTLLGPAAAQGPGSLPPQEVIGIVRDGGFDPLGQPVRRGPNYVLRAIDDYDREVRLVVDGRSGEIVSVTPVTTASRVPPGGSVGPYERMAPGYLPPGPPSAARGGPPPIAGQDDEAPAPRPPAAVPNGSRPDYAARPRPQAPRSAPSDVDEAALPPSGQRAAHSTAIPPPAGDEQGLLPPPPERFPKRVAPTSPKPKPAVKRASAAPPKSAPLPKPRPAVAPPAPPAPEAAPPPPPPAPEPPPPPPRDEMPN